MLGLDEGRRQDIRLAVSELVTVLIRSGLAEVRVVAEVDTDAPLLHLQTDGALPPIPSETAELLIALGAAVWSVDQPWAVRLGDGAGT